MLWGGLRPDVFSNCRLSGVWEVTKRQPRDSAVGSGAWAELSMAYKGSALLLGLACTFTALAMVLSSRGPSASHADIGLAVPPPMTCAERLVGEFAQPPNQPTANHQGAQNQGKCMKPEVNDNRGWLFAFLFAVLLHLHGSMPPV